MTDDYIFSWAENTAGQMVHIDSVPNGKACRCHCPHCKEPLVAKHGEVKAHHFAHHSEIRKATLEICYQVILYKVAEQLIQTHKKIHAPSYYGIFPEKDLNFTDVRIDSQYERADKQPDVVATAEDGTQCLVEFTFDHKVQHKQPIDYANLTCLEIDLSGQSLGTIEKFLFNSTEDRKWLNNQNFFNAIDERYKKAGKNIKVTNESECVQCPIRCDCVGVTLCGSVLRIENSGNKYRLCKPDLYKTAYDAALGKAARQTEEESRRKKEREAFLAEQRRLNAERQGIVSAPSGERSCFNCKSNLRWRSWGGKASCGMHKRLGLPENHSPKEAMKCISFNLK